MGRVLIGNIKGPKGDIGPTGPRGQTGPTGPPGPAGSVNESSAVAFSEADTRENIRSKESLAALFGKIQKWFTDISGGGASTLLGTNLTKSCVLVSDASGKVTVSSITSTILGYLSGLTSNAQNQINERLKKTDVVNNLLTTAAGFALDARQGKVLDDKITELNRNSRETLAAGVTLQRYGKHRILHLVNATSTDGIIATLTTSDWPVSSSFSAIAVRGSSSANLYASVDENGNVIAWNNGKRQSATSAIIGTLEWYVS